MELMCFQLVRGPSRFPPTLRPEPHRERQATHAQAPRRPACRRSPARRRSPTRAGDLDDGLIQMRAAVRTWPSTRRRPADSGTSSSARAASNRRSVCAAQGLPSALSSGRLLWTPARSGHVTAAPRRSRRSSKDVACLQRTAAGRHESVHESVVNNGSAQVHGPPLSPRVVSRSRFLLSAAATRAFCQLQRRPARARRNAPHPRSSTERVVRLSRVVQQRRPAQRQARRRLGHHLDGVLQMSL